MVYLICMKDNKVIELVSELGENLSFEVVENNDYLGEVEE